MMSGRRLGRQDRIGVGWTASDMIIQRMGHWAKTRNIVLFEGEYHETSPHKKSSGGGVEC